jgi:hypothetical protein
VKTYTSKNCDSHVILYAKNHYERGDLITDLKRIYSLRNAIDPEHISKSDILSCLINLVEKFVSNPATECRFSLRNFLSDIDPNSWLYKTVKYDFDTVCIEKCLSIIMLTRILNDNMEEIVPIDNPSEEVLPLSENANKIKEGE